MHESLKKDESQSKEREIAVREKRERKGTKDSREKKGKKGKKKGTHMELCAAKLRKA